MRACRFLWLAAGLMAGVATAYEIPDGGREMLAKPFPDGIRFGNREDPAARHEIVDVKGMPFQKAVRITSTQRTKRSYGIVLHADTRGPIEKGDVALVSLWMRTIRSEDESGNGTASVFLEQNQHPHGKLARLKASAGKEWRHCVASGMALGALGDKQHQVAIHLGYALQTIEIGGLRVLNYGDAKSLKDMPYTKVTYEGREPDAAWRKAAAETIEKYRKRDLEVRVVDGDGKPVSGAKVSVKMKRHAFDFGCVLNPRAFSLQDEYGRRYREIFEKYFTKAPTESGFRWHNWIRGTKSQRADRMKELEDALAWLNERSIEVRGHYLMWAPIEPRNKPEELVDKPDQLLEALWKHAELKAKWAGTRVQEWDAINHIEGWGTRFADVCGGNKVYAEMIRKGRRWVPHAEMWVNEGQVLVGDGTRMEAYSKIIEDLISMDAKPDGIGFMGHYRDSGLPHPQEVYERLEHFAKYGCKMQLTEFDVECGRDEELQADYLRDIMTIAFSHPGVEAIVMWGFQERCHWRPAAALWRKDWSIRPAGEAWVDLVRGKWWTDETLTTDGKGIARARCFLGTHTIQVGKNQETTVISAAQEPLTIRLSQ